MWALDVTLTMLFKLRSSRSRHVPYRDSRLTRLLEESLGPDPRERGVEQDRQKNVMLVHVRWQLPHDSPGGVFAPALAMPLLLRTRRKSSHTGQPKPQASSLRSSSIHASETLSTLRFALRARKVENSA